MGALDSRSKSLCYLIITVASYSEGNKGQIVQNYQWVFILSFDDCYDTCNCYAIWHQILVLELYRVHTLLAAAASAFCNAVYLY